MAYVMPDSCVGVMAAWRWEQTAFVLIWIGSDLGKSGRWCSIGGDRRTYSLVLIRTGSAVFCGIVCSVGKSGTELSEGGLLTSAWVSCLPVWTFFLLRISFVNWYTAFCVAVRAVAWARSDSVSSRCPPWAASRSWLCSFSAPVKSPRRRSSFGAD